jgi:hypothetical protein
MVDPWRLLVVCFAGAIAFAASITFVLADARGPGPSVRPPAEVAALADRADCNQIYGTAYRSDAERRWFNDNCSTWSKSVGIVPEPDAPVAQAQPSPPAEGRDCNQINGTAYRSEGERTWYLANCGSAKPAGDQQASAGPDRTDCNQIRGTPYRSDTERLWYLANCRTQPTTAPTPQPALRGATATQPPALVATPAPNSNQAGPAGGAGSR